MAIYSQDVKLCATAYVRADSPEEAARIIAANFGAGSCGEIPIGEGVGVTVSGRMFDDPRLADVSLSPAVSFYGPWSDDQPAPCDDGEG